MQEEANELLSTVIGHKDSNYRITDKFSHITNYFGEINDILVFHIGESEDVSEKLIHNVNKVKSFSLND